MDKTSLFYSKNAENYINESFTFDMGKFYNFSDTVISQQNLKTVLDAGFGSGRDMLYFKSKGLEVTGIDNCQEFVEKAKEKGLNVYQERLPFIQNMPVQKFDLIYSVGLIFHLCDIERITLFDSFKNMLNPNGVIILSYNDLDRTNDKDRFFDKINKEQIDKEVGLTIISEEIMKDKRNINWITVAYKGD